ncbi:MAG: sulfurtransferase TusA family protein [Spirochaetales bacterium]|nr:sulfurtransferase TusA family protein [Spirochaetales bacterium]
MTTTHKLDITQEHCPMTFVKTRLALEKMNKGEILEVTLTEGEALKSIPISVEELGYKILQIKHIEKNIHKIYIQK